MGCWKGEREEGTLIDLKTSRNSWASWVFSKTECLWSDSWWKILYLNGLRTYRYATCMSTYLLLDLRINCLRLASGTMRYWLPSKSNRIVSPGKTAFIKLKILLDRMMLRRTNVCFFSNLTMDSLPEGCQVQRAGDLRLPPKTIVAHCDYFSCEEKALYLSLYDNVSRQLSTCVDQGTVLNSVWNWY